MSEKNYVELVTQAGLQDSLKNAGGGAKSVNGTLNAPFDDYLVTDLGDEQRSGVFVNYTDAPVIIETCGVSYRLGVSQSLSAPIDSALHVSASGNGSVVWIATTDTLDVQVGLAPARPSSGQRPTPFTAREMIMGTVGTYGVLLVGQEAVMDDGYSSLVCLPIDREPNILYSPENSGPALGPGPGEVPVYESTPT